MYTAATLKTQTVKDLGKIATKLGVSGWRSMKKDELVKALVKAARSKARSSAAASKRSTAASKRSAAASKRSSATNRKSPVRTTKTVTARTKTTAKSSAKKSRPKAKSPRTVKKIQRANEARAAQKDLAAKAPAPNGKAKKNGAPAKPQSDRMVLLVRDAYWLQAIWELSRQSVDRAQAAMAEHWHTAKPLLRLIELDAGATTNTAERVVREIEIHGGVKTWYIDVHDSPKNYRVDIGYLATNGKFFTLGRSNAVTTPRPGNGDAVEQSWSDIAENCEKIYALSGGYTDENSTKELQELFEERLGRPMGAPVATRFGVGADKSLTRHRDFEFEVDAEMIIFGRTRPNAHVSLAGTPLKLRPDGSFSARLSMPDRRQVLPIVASSADGVEQRTVVLAVERNTKVMEPMIRESSE